MKYICTETLDGTKEIFTFPNTVDHDVMAESICRMKNQSWGNWERVVREPISAGFVEGTVCFGKSETLNLSSRFEDTELLRSL